MRNLLSFFLACLLSQSVYAQDFSAEACAADFEQFWELVDERFAYFHTQKTDWKKVKQIYTPQLETVDTQLEFIELLEKVIAELYNGHVSLGVNTATSPRLIPSGSDFWVERIDGKYLIQAVKSGGKAEKAGMKVGMEVLAFHDESIVKLVGENCPQSFYNYDLEVYRYVANGLLAGRRDRPRKIICKDAEGKNVVFGPDGFQSDRIEGLIQHEILEGNIGYVHFNNSLGNDVTVADFDRYLDELIETDGLILDLRNTPGGGTNTVAKGVLGRLIDQEIPFQRYRFMGDERATGVLQYWVEQLMPRKKVYDKPVVVLCGPWTGSVGEAMVMNLSTSGRAKALGTRMAGLLGAVNVYRLDHTGIRFQIPVTRLYDAAGMPREDFRPDVEVLGNEACLEKALEILKE